MKVNSKVDVSALAAAAAGGANLQELELENYWRVECLDAAGNVKWVDEFTNLVTTAGKNDILTQYFKGAAYTAAFYVGLTSATPTVNVADTMASHAGWTEVVAYSQANRVVYTAGAVSAGSADNSGSVAAFTINANATALGGAFLTTVNTKSGTTGTLYGVGALSNGDKTLSNGDTLNVTITVTAS